MIRAITSKITLVVRTENSNEMLITNLISSLLSAKRLFKTLLSSPIVTKLLDNVFGLFSNSFNAFSDVVAIPYKKQIFDYMIFV